MRARKTAVFEREGVVSAFADIGGVGPGGKDVRDFHDAEGAAFFFDGSCGGGGGVDACSRGAQECGGDSDDDAG